MALAKEASEVLGLSWMILAILLGSRRFCVVPDGLGSGWVGGCAGFWMILDDLGPKSHQPLSIVFLCLHKDVGCVDCPRRGMSAVCTTSSE